MFEVIYISPSCNQALGFIYALAVRLKECGIADFEIDREHIRLKTDKFIVSAVPINGGNIYKSYHRVKYYIDRSSMGNFETEYTRRCIRDITERVKHSFPKDTKEISEEELIDILTEVSG